MNENESSAEKFTEQNSPLNNSPDEAKKKNAEENISDHTPVKRNQQSEITRPGLSDTMPEAIERTSGREAAEFKQPEIVQPPTENMEVHHHPHVHHSKKWKDYLFEFLMLFLAVSAGFFVENQREHYIEHKRAKQFSRQLLADLRLDSALFENKNRDIQLKQKGYDKLQDLLTKKNDATDREVLETLLAITFVFDFPATSTTYNQMKTSGSLRYIDNADLTAHLQQYYDVLLPRIVRIADASLAYFSENINPFYMKHIRIQDYDPFNDTLINKNPLIMGRSSQTDQELANIMGGFRSLLKIQEISMNTPALMKIKESIALVKKEYHLE